VADDDAPVLNRAYLLDHKDVEEGEVRRAAAPDAGPGTVSDVEAHRAFRNMVLDAAVEQLGDGEAAEMTVMVPVQIRALDNRPLKGCISVDLGPVDIHWDFKGKKPGEG